MGALSRCLSSFNLEAAVERPSECVPRGLGTAADAEPDLDASLVFDPATILVVDDAPLNRLVLVDFLRRYGFVLLEAEDGARALG